MISVEIDKNISFTTRLVERSDSLNLLKRFPGLKMTRSQSKQTNMFWRQGEMSENFWIKKFKV